MLAVNISNLTTLIARQKTFLVQLKIYLLNLKLILLLVISVHVNITQLLADIRIWIFSFFDSDLGLLERNIFVHHSVSLISLESLRSAASRTQKLIWRRIVLSLDRSDLIHVCDTNVVLANNGHHSLSVCRVEIFHTNRTSVGAVVFVDVLITVDVWRLHIFSWRVLV